MIHFLGFGTFFNPFSPAGFSVLGFTFCSASFASPFDCTIATANPGFRMVRPSVLSPTASMSRAKRLLHTLQPLRPFLEYKR